MAALGSNALDFPLDSTVRKNPDGDRINGSCRVLRGRAISEDGRTSVSEQQEKRLNWDHSRGTGGYYNAFDRGENNEDILNDFTVSSSGADGQKDEYWKSMERCISAATKGFVIGAGLRGGLALVGVLSRLTRRKPSLSGKSNADAIRLALKETLRYGLFVGSFAGTFCTVDEAIAAIAGGKRTARWRALVAGAVAGPSLLLTGSQMRHTSMAIYIFMRASVLAARCGIKSKSMGSICRPLTWKHGDAFLMCLSSSQILYAWILYPKSLPSSYISFLNKHGGKHTSILYAFRALVSQKGLSEHISAINQHYHNKGVNVKITSDIKIPCAMVHGDQGCEQHFFSFIGDAYLRALPVYLPVYLVPALLVHRQGLFARPLPLLSKSLLGTARSSLFLATYCASAWLWTCWAFRALGTCNHPLVAAATFPTGLSVLIEKKSRRMELALYCFSRAVESFSICVSDSGLFKQYKLTLPNRIDVCLFSVATSIIMHCYAEERDVFRSKYLNVLDWVFGIPDLKKSATPSDVQSKDAIAETVTGTSGPGLN